MVNKILESILNNYYILKYRVISQIEGQDNLLYIVPYKAPASKAVERVV